MRSVDSEAMTCKVGGTLELLVGTDDIGSKPNCICNTALHKQTFFKYNSAQRKK